MQFYSAIISRLLQLLENLVKVTKRLKCVIPKASLLNQSALQQNDSKRLVQD